MVSLGSLKCSGSDILLSPGVRLASSVKRSLICQGMSRSSDIDEFERDKKLRCTSDHGIISLDSATSVDPSSGTGCKTST